MEPLLDWYCREELLEEIREDLWELYQVWLAGRGQRYARFMYLWSVIRFFRPYKCLDRINLYLM